MAAMSLMHWLGNAFVTANIELGKGYLSTSTNLYNNFITLEQ